MVLSYDYSNQNSRQWQMNAPPLQAILMAMAVRRLPVRYRAHCLMNHDQGFTGSHWTPPLVDYLLCIAPVATMATINKMMMQNVPTLLAISMAIAVRRYYTGSRLYKKPLNAGIGRALAPILPNWTCQCRLFWTFHCEKGLQLTCWPLITIGV